MLYEVFTPFVVFLLAEELRVSGILAVVAAGGFPCSAHAHQGASKHRADAAGARGLFGRAAGRGRGQDVRSVDLQGRGKIDEDIAQQLRQNVYVLQMNAEAE